jgi:hypothetical protein
LNMSAWVLLLASAVGPSDTIIAVERGDVLEVEHLVGHVEIEAWDRDVIELDDGSDRGRRPPGADVRREGGRISIRPDRRREASGVNRRYALHVPRWLPVEVWGEELDVDVQGVRAGVTVNTSDGDVWLRDVVGAVTVNAIDGSVSVVNASGVIVINASDDDVRVTDSEGTVIANSVDGDVHLESVDMESVMAATIDGDVSYSGHVYASGSYQLTTHDGNVSFALPEGVGADVRVFVGDGRFTSDFRVSVRQVTGGRSYQMTIGEGGADVRLDAFDGDVRIRTWNPR